MFTADELRAIEDYAGPITVGPATAATGCLFTIEDSTLAAIDPPVKRGRQRRTPSQQARHEAALLGEPSPLQAARKAGEPFYHGNSCKRCGGTLKYSKDASCVPCTRAKAKERARKWKERNKT